MKNPMLGIEKLYLEPLFKTMLFFSTKGGLCNIHIYQLGFLPHIYLYISILIYTFSMLTDLEPFLKLTSFALLVAKKRTAHGCHPGP